MDYFDNGQFFANMNDLPKPGKAIGWLILSLVLTGSIAGLFIYKYKKIEKELEKLGQHSA